jgi:hypothetical protein
MITIPVRVCGDYWINPQEVQALLDSAGGKDSVALDLQFEGPSLTALGIIDCVAAYCCKYQVAATQIYIKHWPNKAETVEYNLIDANLISHFFACSKSYWATPPASTRQYTLGFFIGRRAIPRAVIMHYLYCAYGDSVLLSCLQNKDDQPWLKGNQSHNLEQIDMWLTREQQPEFTAWWATDPIASLDNHTIGDQYTPEPTTNQDLLAHYAKFDIELVAESYTRGASFFPTEKTVRPLMAAKPMLVYGPPGYLERLQLLGFETYNSVWDESYDCLEGPDRWAAMKQLIDNIMCMSSIERSHMIDAADKIAQRNRQHLANIIKLS